jgi:hypothetical protein
MVSGEMAGDVGETPAECGEVAAGDATLPADEAELGVAFGGEAGEQAVTIRKTPQIASSPR